MHHLKRFHAMQRTAWADPFRAPQLVTALLAVAWGLWLITPAWNTFEHSASYATMAAIAPEGFWGWLFVIAGWANYLAIVTARIRMQRATAVALVMLWVFVASQIAISNISGTGVPAYTGLAVLTAVRYWHDRRLRP